MHRSCLVLFVLAAFVANDSAAGVRLTLERSLGAEGDELFLHAPSSPCFAPDGSIYLLNGGECQVLHLNADWELLDAFGRCGRGPGEFEKPVGMVLFAGDLWVFEMARISIYGLDGAHLRTLQPGTQFALPAVVDGNLMAVMGAGDRPAAYLGGDGRVLRGVGPECPVAFFDAFKACRNMQILPHVDGACLLVNAVDGRAILVDEDDGILWERNLIRHEDDARYAKSDDGDSMSMSLTLGMGHGCRDARGRYWMITYGDQPEAPPFLQVLDKDLAALERNVPLPEGTGAWELLFSPRGRLVMVSPGESVIHLCEVEVTAD